MVLFVVKHILSTEDKECFEDRKLELDSLVPLFTCFLWKTNNLPGEVDDKSWFSSVINLA